MQLGPRAHHAQYQLTHVPTIGSTNAELLIHANAANAGNHWLVADTQSAGHGRRAKSWVSPTGNLYASVLLCAPCPTQNLSELPFVAGLALHEAIDPQGQNITLKWPNDLMVNAKKTAGILVEASPQKGTNPALYNAVIGFGVNCVSHPDDTNHPATNLAGQGMSLSRQDLFAALSDSMINWLDIWQRGENFAEIRNAWLARAHGLNQPIRVNLPSETLEGIFTGLDETGHLLLQLGDGSVKPIRTGDVFALPNPLP